MKKRMKLPPHPGKGIKQDFEALDLSIAEAALALAMSRQQLNRIVNGSSDISHEVALKLEAVIGSHAEQWLRLQNAHSLAQIRNGDNHPAKGLKRLHASV